MSNIPFNDAKIQLADTLKKMYLDWKADGYIKGLTSYCNGTAFPYNHLRKLEGLNLIKSLTASNRNKTYRWQGEDEPNFESLAALIINSGNPSRSKNPEASKRPEFNFLHLGKGQNVPQSFQRLTPKQGEAPDQSIKLAIKIALILKENGVPDDKVESITSSIISIL